MSYKILITPINGHFQATALGFSNIAVEAPTRAEAIEQASTAIQKLLSTGDLVEVTINPPKKRKTQKLFIQSESNHVDIETPSSSFADMGGIWKNNPLFDRFVEAMKQYREEVDNDPKQP